MSNTGADFEMLAQEVINAAHDGMSVSDCLKKFCGNFLRDLAREECVNCRRGDNPSPRPHKGLYAHRLPEGKNGSLIWLPCRAAFVWRRITDLGVEP